MLIAWPAGSATAGSIESVRGHFGLGYGKLLNPETPAGSLAASAGIDLPVRSGLRAGVDVGFFLLGSQVVDSGSLSAGVDYSMFEALALVHWAPRPGMLVSLGPGLAHARASLSSAAPAAFDSVAVEETTLGAGVGVSFMPGGESLVKAGVELGVRAAWLERRTWTILFARAVVHY